jgi:hypothetical protein
MSDPRTLLSNMKRPRLLIRAARCGLVEYRRDRDLRRLIGAQTVPTPSVSVPRLLSEEAHLETIRCAGDAGYSVARHIEVLIALMSEANLLPRTQAA